jgi:hypothetical protein
MGVLREMIDAVRSRRPDGAVDPLIRCLVTAPPADGGRPSTVDDLDRDLYGASSP